MCAVPRGAFAGAPLVLAPCGSSALEAFTHDAAAGTFALAASPSLCIDAGTAAGSCADAPTSAFPFCDPALDARARAADLAGRLTADEAASLVSNENFGVPRFGIARVGYGEALHGYLRECVATPVPGSTGCPTSFPHLHLLGGSFNRTLWHAVAAAIADEARAYFNLVNRSSHLVSWAPDINPFRDPRWGRGQEVASEDPLHLSEFIAQYARGLQEGEDAAHIKLVSTAKQ
jgi:beta-D-xylosidase 4